MPSRVLLVSMPFGTLTAPSIQLGILSSVLRRAGAPAEVRYLNLRWLRWVLDATEADGQPIGRDEVDEVVERHHGVALGDWIFATAAFPEHAAATERRYLDLARERGVGERALAAARRMRALAPAFVDEAAREVAASSPEVVGFGTQPGQLVAALALARRLKELEPAVAIVFGGASCLGPMGVALHRAFPWIDVVVRGEAERVLPELVGDLLAARTPRRRPGLCLRRDGGTIALDEDPVGVPMAEVPAPDYDDYFAELAATGLEPVFGPDVRLPIETARGCWWAERSHCAFCGLNGARTAFRCKTAARVAREVAALARRHRRLDFVAVDNIMGPRHHRTLLPRLGATGMDLRLFWEVKANLGREPLTAMARAGVVCINPGIESLSTPVLARMRKGVTAIDNVRLLKLCAELGIAVVWNLLYGIPGEPESEYEAMASLVPSLVHLAPPALNRLHLDRFSPYHERPDDHGLRVLGPRRDFELIYALGASELGELAWTFEHVHADGRDPEVYVEPLRKAVAWWRAESPGSLGGLRYRRGAGFLRITDRRAGREAADYTLDAREAVIFQACDAGATPTTIRASLARSGHSEVTHESIVRFLDDLVATGLVAREGSRYLTLALADSPRCVTPQAGSLSARRPGG